MLKFLKSANLFSCRCSFGRVLGHWLSNAVVISKNKFVAAEHYWTTGWATWPKMLNFWASQVDRNIVFVVRGSWMLKFSKSAGVLERDISFKFC